MLANAVKETTSTAGTGTVTLSAVSNYARFSSVFMAGMQASYCIVDSGGSKEWGIGTVGAGNTLARTKVMATLVGGTYTTAGATPIFLSGDAEVFVDMHSGIWASVAGATRTADQYLVSHGCTGGVSNDGSLQANELWAFLCLIARPFRVDALMIDVRTASGTSLLATVYQGSDDGPSARMFDPVTFDTSSTGGKTVTLSSPVVLMPGTYYITGLPDGTPSLRGFHYASAPSLGRSDLVVTANENYLRKTGWSFGSGLPDPAPSGFVGPAFGRSPSIFLRGGNL